MKNAAAEAVAGGAGRPRAGGWSVLGALGATAVLGGCAIVMPELTTTSAAAPSVVRPGVAPPPPSPPAQAASVPRAPGAAPTAAATPPSSSLRPFADVVRDARSSEGLFTLWQKDDKVWIELKPEDLDRPFYLSPKVKTGIGEGSFLGGMMSDDEGIVEFRRIHNQLQLIRRNTAYIAPPGSPEARAVAAAFSPSLLASTVVASQPHPTRRSILVEANALFVTDLLGASIDLQRRYRQGYNFDGRNSAITATRATADTVVFEVLGHYATGSLAPPSPGAPGPTVPRSLPDPRSMFATMHYTLARLPAEPMRPRPADARIGHFTTTVADFADDSARAPQRRYIARWRLEKQDPAAALSPPVKPIVFWIDRTVPERYRAAIAAGVLEWNKAFERIGFQDALAVEVQPDDADFDTLDFGRASIRWMTNASISFGAVGPHHHDPRTGEILDADIAIESLASRSIRAIRSQVLVARADGLGAEGGGAIGVGADAAALPQASPGAAAARAGRECLFAESAAEQMAYALDVLEARGDLDPAGPEAQRFVEQYLRELTTHEVGHALGLRHNFRASRAYSEAQLADPAFTEEHGITGSVMDYAPINLAAPGGEPGEAHGAQFGTALGPYDYWAIEYAYRPFAAGLSAADETAELRRIAARSTDPLLAFGTDEDNSLGLDPESLMFDLGSDVLAFARKRVAIARDLLARQEGRTLREGDDLALLRRSVIYAVRDVSRAATVLVRQIGGVRTLRDAPGSGRDPLQPVPATRQREALDLLTDSVLSADALRISPALQRRLAPDWLERRDALTSTDAAAVATDFSLSGVVLDMQRSVVAALMSDATAARLVDSREKAPDGEARSLPVAELYAQLTRAVWSELDRRDSGIAPGTAVAARAGRDAAAAGRAGVALGSGGMADAIAPRRRELQRDHVNRLAGLMLRPQALSRADARGSLRVEARALAQRLDAAVRHGGYDADTLAHLQDSAETLRRALEARLERAGA